MKRYLFSQIRSLRYLLVLGDILVISVSILIAYLINFAFFTHRSFSFHLIAERALPLGIIIASFIFIFYLIDLYDIDKLKNLFRCTLIIAGSVLIVSLISSGILFFFTKYIIGRRVIIISIPIVISLLILWRFIYTSLFVKSEKARRLALIGNKEIVTNFIDEFARMGIAEFRITQICLTDMKNDDESLLSQSTPDSVTVYKSIDDLMESEDFDVLAYDYTQGEMSSEEIHRIMELRFKDKFIYDFPSFYEELTGKVPLNYIDSRWLLSEAELQGKVSKLYTRIKRFLDILISAVLLVITFPLFVLTALAVKLESRGRVLFSQERLGLRKHPFTCYKFRTMRLKAEEETGPTWSSKDDPRITRVGKILRRTRLDELPQLWNILKGDMSFVGTRPIRKFFADQLAEMIPY